VKAEPFSGREGMPYLQNHRPRPPPAPVITALVPSSLISLLLGTEWNCAFPSHCNVMNPTATAITGPLARPPR